MAAGKSRDAWYVTEGIVYEFLRVATHPGVFGRPLSWREAMRFLRPLLGSGRFFALSAGDGRWRVLEEVLATLVRPSGNLFFDARTAVIMREHGIRRIYTADTDFLQFQAIEVVDPLRDR